MPLSEKEKKHFRTTRKRAHAVWTGELLEITYLDVPREYHRVGKRKLIKGFTPGARLRMLRTIASIEWDSFKKGVFITLTYPNEFHGRTMSERNRDRYLFMRSMEKHLGRKVGAVWRIEWEKRKTGAMAGKMFCHVHIIVFNCRFIHKDVVRDGWRRALNAEGPLITWIDGIACGRKASRYVSKYCAKSQEAGVLDDSTYLNTSGRHWGMHRKPLIPFAFRVHVPFLDDDMIRLAENLAASKFRFFTKGTGNGFSIFGKDAKKIGEEIFLRDVDRHG